MAKWQPKISGLLFVRVYTSILSIYTPQPPQPHLNLNIPRSITLVPSKLTSIPSSNPFVDKFKSTSEHHREPHLLCQIISKSWGKPCHGLTPNHELKVCLLLFADWSNSFEVKCSDNL